MELQQHHDEIAQTGAEVLAISTDDLSGASDIIQQGNINFPILYTSGDSAVPEAYTSSTCSATAWHQHPFS